MKKIIMGIVIALSLSVSVFADSIDLGNFPLGKWVDSNYDAVWSFSSGSIKILNMDESVVYCDFSQKTIEDWKVGLEGGKGTLTFECPETGRVYKFSKGLGSELTLMIKRSNLPDYTVVMSKK